MQTFIEKKFVLGELKGISAKNIEEHLKLYAGYVKHANIIQEKIKEYSQDIEKNGYIIGILHRRLGFEFGGMRNHEYYFASLENGPKNLSEDSELKKAIAKDFDSFEEWLNKFKNSALSRWSNISKAACGRACSKKSCKGMMPLSAHRSKAFLPPYK